MEQILILKPFNGVFFGTFAIFCAIFVALSLLVRKRSETFRRRLLAGLMLATLAGFVVYKIFLWLDAPYSALCAEAGKGGFNWWGELPLQLCNINMILIPVAMLTRKRALESFAFFFAPLGAGMALAMPGIGFDQYSILLPRMLGFFGTHFMVFFGGIALCSFGIYRPRFADLLPALLSACVLNVAIFGVNMLLRVTGLNPFSNYFYNVSTEGNAILELFYSWLPVPLLYMIPCLLIAVPYMLLVTTPFALCRRKKVDETA